MVRARRVREGPLEAGALPTARTQRRRPGGAASRGSRGPLPTEPAQDAGREKPHETSLACPRFTLEAKPRDPALAKRRSGSRSTRDRERDQASEPWLVADQRDRPARPPQRRKHALGRRSGREPRARFGLGPAERLAKDLGGLSSSDERARKDPIDLGIEERQAPCSSSEFALPLPREPAGGVASASSLGLGFAVSNDVDVHRRQSTRNRARLRGARQNGQDPSSRGGPCRTGCSS